MITETNYISFGDWVMKSLPRAFPKYYKSDVFFSVLT